MPIFWPLQHAGGIRTCPVSKTLAIGSGTWRWRPNVARGVWKQVRLIIGVDGWSKSANTWRTAGSRFPPARAIFVELLLFSSFLSSFLLKVYSAKSSYLGAPLPFRLRSRPHPSHCPLTSPVLRPEPQNQRSPDSRPVGTGRFRGAWPGHSWEAPLLPPSSGCTVSLKR